MGGQIMGELSTEWAERGLCRTADPAIFFSNQSGDQTSAKRICRDCSVRRECLAYAILMDEEFGIWGGHNRAERRRMAKLGSGLDGFTDGLRHQLAWQIVEPVKAEQQDWSIF